MKSWYSMRARALDTVTAGAEISIYDKIGAYGVSAKGFLAELGALPGTAPIDLRLNSPGGSVFDAVAIYNALKRHEGTVMVWIDGIAASAASYVAMAGDEIVMPENAFLMIHDPAGLVMGTAEDMRSMAEALDKVKGSLVQGHASKSGRAPEEIAALMSAETWFDAKDALDAGLATRIAEPVRIAASFDIVRFRNAPPELVDAVQSAEEAVAEDSSGSEAPADDAEETTAGSEDPQQPLAGESDETATSADPAPVASPPSGAPPDPAPPDPVAIRALSAFLRRRRPVGPSISSSLQNATSRRAVRIGAHFTVSHQDGRDQTHRSPTRRFPNWILLN